MSSLVPLLIGHYQDVLRAEQTFGGVRRTAAQRTLEARVLDDLERELRRLYQEPFRGGYQLGAPDDTAEAINDWLLGRYRDNPRWSDGLRQVLIVFLTRAVELGGAAALREMGGPADDFDLVDESVLSDLADRVDQLLMVDGDLSLLKTTAKRLSTGIIEGLAQGLVLAAIVTALAVADSKLRSVAIADTESQWAFHHGLTWTYQANGVTELVFDTDGDACPICKPHDGKRVMLPVPKDLRIPLHVMCDCKLTLASKPTAPKTWWVG
jgi:hypothetical protein